VLISAQKYQIHSLRCIRQLVSTTGFTWWETQREIDDYLAKWERPSEMTRKRKREAEFLRDYVAKAFDRLTVDERHELEAAHLNHR
jgi:hypothetical protein